MRRMGFNEHWIGLVMLCVRTATYSILVNGEPKGLIHPLRGLRQGDPLSPFLFLLCTEGLHGFIAKATSEGDLRGFSICRQGPKLTHLFFADDSLLFCRANSSECGNILNLLAMYQSSPGQKVNKEKTNLFFNKSTLLASKNTIMSLLGL